MKDNVLGYLLRINRLRIRSLRESLVPMGYTGVMHLILLYVNAHPGASQEEVTGHYALDKTSVARDARKLEELGHIRRSPDPDNRRRYRLELTPAGRETAVTLMRLFDEYDGKLSEGLPAEEWNLLRQLLGRVEENARRAIDR